MGTRPRHPCPTVAELVSVATRPVLHKCDAISLIQGFRPDSGRTDKIYSYLEEYAPQVSKINLAEANGEILFPIKCCEFVIWCNKYSIALPDLFIHEIIKKIIRVRRPKSIGSFTDELIRLSDNDHDREKIGRGKKPRKEATVRGYETKIINLARTCAISHIEKNGALPPKKELNYQLAKLMNRHEIDIDRAFDLSALLTPNEKKRHREKFRRQRQQDVRDGLYPPE